MNQSILKISELFSSIQGEGPLAGTSCIFLRLSTCNLKCSWCDTKYTWDWENYDINKEIKEMSIDEIVEKIHGFSNISHIVITGGEPLLQQDKLVLLLTLLKDKKKIDNNAQSYNIEIETNGTIIPLKELMNLVDQWNISPKTSNSLNEEHGINLERFYGKSLSFYKDSKNAFFKFVVDELDDMVEIEYIIKKYDLPKKRVILMPQAITKEKLLEKSAWIHEYAKKNSFTFSSRLQVLLWNNQRGK
ncbi:MAG: 7-carboxy-7-deazaguanine synthase QueE [Thermoproteota archaeon]|nr:7-carboxy-7-deazaguanine synthase QueE [Thermoproteota archaeon]